MARLSSNLSRAQCGTGIDEFSYFAPRMPFKPVSIATVSGAA